MDYNKTFMNMLPYVVGLIAVYIGLNTFFGVDLSEMVSKNVVENMENDVKPVEEPSSSLPENKVELETPVVDPQELLPKDDNLGFALSNPTGQGSLEDKNFLKAGYHIGINTIGQSLKNANYQVRSDPAIPKVPVSIFNNSTISGDTTRRPLEIGESK
jgi:hypothetical protein